MALYFMASTRGGPRITPILTNNRRSLFYSCSFVLFVDDSSVSTSSTNRTVSTRLPTRFVQEHVQAPLLIPQGRSDLVEVTLLQVGKRLLIGLFQLPNPVPQSQERIHDRLVEFPLGIGDHP